MEEYRKLKVAIENQAEFIHHLQFSDLSEKTVEQAKLILLDSIGCMAAGNREYTAAAEENGTFVQVGTGKKRKEAAVLFNGAAMVKNELDEGNQFAFGHPACHIIPAFLAEVQERNVSGCEAITALTAAYEVSCRWGGSTKIRAVMHCHGTMQTAGSVAVSCKLNRCNTDEVAAAVILANSLPQCASWESAFHGDQIRNAYIGMSNVVGMNSLSMVRAGITGSIETLYSVWNDVLGGSIDTEGLIRNLKKEYLIEKNYFKIHAACRYTHCFADMLTRFFSQGFMVGDIRRIDIETYAAASKLSGQGVSNSFAMKFSIPVSLAVCIVYGDLSIENVTDEHVANPEVKRLAANIFVRENETFTEQLPDTRRNKMTIMGENGKIYEEDSSVTKGDYLDPFGREELIAKFNQITEKVWSCERQKEIVDYVLSLEQKKDLKKLFDLTGRENSVRR